MLEERLVVAPWVKNYGVKNSFDRGEPLEAVWLTR